MDNAVPSIDTKLLSADSAAVNCLVKISIWLSLAPVALSSAFKTD